MDRVVAGALSLFQACALNWVLSAAAVTSEAQERAAVPVTTKHILHSRSLRWARSGMWVQDRSLALRPTSWTILV
jgi:hypothetical protein